MTASSEDPGSRNEAEPPLTRSERLQRLAQRRFRIIFIGSVLLAVAGYVCWFGLHLKAVGVPMFVVAGAALILLNYFRYADLSSLPDGGGPLNL